MDHQADSTLIVIFQANPKERGVPEWRGTSQSQRVKRDSRRLTSLCPYITWMSSVKSVSFMTKEIPAVF